MRQSTHKAVSLYREAKDFVFSAGYSDEVEWQKDRCLETTTESDFLREAAWVILCSGFKENVVSRYFNYITLCFCDWESASEIVGCGQTCVNAALPAFNNARKLQAVLETAEIVDRLGYSALRKEICAHPITTLKRFPYIGEVTSWHLAKNLGLQVAKPDRHLVRFSNAAGFDCVQKFCGAIAEITGDAINVVDIILWRYGASGLRQAS
ncbi:MAG: hypothetical protein RIA64_16535 [Rhodospirillales bacterium]